MAENNKPDSQNAVFAGQDSGSRSPAKSDRSAQPVYPFLEDADTLELQTLSQGTGKLKNSPKPQPVEVSMAPSSGPLGVFLLIVLGLALIALVGTCAYLLLFNPERLLEIVAGISSLFSR